MKMVLDKGSGSLPRPGDVISMHCVGYLDENPPVQFWSTRELGQRIFSFAVGKKQVIKGWDEGAASMKLREKSRLKIEAKKAYGVFGFEAWGIPPNCDIILELEVVSIRRMRQL
uniref:peptidylprolyl isomerase n=2 Tax=Ciona intestinalis TaxID=7719 RepID=H2XPT9_CIOIN